MTFFPFKLAPRTSRSSCLTGAKRAGPKHTQSAYPKRQRPGPNIVTKYPVNDLFYTLQGEGMQTGVPAVFLRLQGCDVGCPFCDTRETWAMNPDHEVATLEAACGEPLAYIWLSAEEIAGEISTRWPQADWVVVTGGEPAQYPLRALVDALNARGLKTAIETSGTEIGHVDAGFDWVTVSPKIDMPGGFQIQSEAMASADEIKHVVGRPRDVEQLDALLAAHPTKKGAQVFLQPMSLNPRATQLAIDVVKQRGWRLSVQVHKYIDIP